MQNYVVQKDDTLWKIGRKFGVTVNALAIENHLRGKQIHFLRVGQNLRIPTNDQSKPDTVLSLKFRALDHTQFTPPKVRVEHDGSVAEHLVDSNGWLSLGIFDHANGLKVWIEDMEKKFVQVLDRPILPLGRWNVSVDSRQVAVKGNLEPKRGPARSTTPATKEETTHNAKQNNGETARAQTRTEQGKPVHALATVYTEANLRLAPGNEPYRKHIIAAADTHGLTPQSLAALVDAEAAKIKGVWQEKSNSTKPKLAQGLAQFFAAAWMDVFNNSDSLLHAECQKMNKQALLAKRLEARYAIDGAATYAAINLKNFARLTKFNISSLPPEDKAKVAYLLHHEGLGGALRLIGKGKEWTEADAEAQLIAQFGGNAEKAETFITQHGGKARNAYKAWLYAYTDAKINVNNFLIQDAQKFSTLPRETTEIMGGLSPEAATVKPTPRSLPSAPGPSTPPPAATAPLAGEQSGKWRDPLDVCTLRTAGLASKRSAQFGMVRNGGKRAHQGIDLVAAPGTPVYAVADGTVYIGRSPSKAYDYGDTLILEVNVNDLPEAQAAAFRKINPGKRTIGFFYAHLSEFCVKSGPVSGGTIIAKSGCSGNAKDMKTVGTGAHLHLEVRQDALTKCAGLVNRVDPLLFIQNCTNR